MFPKWLPSPKAFGQTIVFSLQMIPVGFVVSFYTRFWPIFDASEEKTYILREPIAPTAPIDPNTVATNPVLIALGIIVLLMIFVVPVIFTLYLMAMIHQFLWDEPLQNWPRFLPRPRCWLEALWGVLIIAVSSIPGVIIMLDSSYSNDYDNLIGVLFMVSLAYCFHVRNLIFPKKKKEI